MVLGRRRNLPYQSLVHVAISERRAFGWLTDRIDGLEASGKFAGKLIKFLAQQYVVVAVDTENECDGRLVVGVAKDTLC